ncbi:MAG: hypothetical protein KY432_08140 [Acidobacteria bacterium]|nr:hypothetical protein [Acidobacteriota bacterium]
MRRLSIILASIVAVAVPGFGEECRVDRFYQQRGYPVEIEVSGERLMVADGAGLRLFDLSEPSSPVPQAATFESTPALAVESIDETHAALLVEDGLLLYDVSGEEPVLIASRSVSGTALHRLGAGLVVVGDTLALFELQSSQLIEQASVGLPAGPDSSATMDGDLLVSIQGIGTLRFDEFLHQKGKVRVAASAIQTDGSIAFLGRGTMGVYAVDWGSGADAVVLDHLSGGVVADEILLHDNELLATGGSGIVHRIDISDPGNLVLRTETEADVDLMAAGDRFVYAYAFFRDRFGVRFENGPYLTVRDLWSENLDAVNTIGESTGPLSDVAVDGSIAWIADPPFVRAIDLKSGEELWRLQIDEPFNRIRYERGLLILFGATWVHLIEPGPESGRLLGSWETLGIPGGGVTFSGQWLIEANRASGFHDVVGVELARVRDLRLRALLPGAGVVVCARADRRRPDVEGDDARHARETIPRAPPPLPARARGR